jgi:two-component system, sensor histidine kinase and response regulator
METLKVLVVDDEPGIRSGVARILGKHVVSLPFMDDDYNFVCIEAATGEEGIKTIDKENPDIVLLDNKLPGIKGMEVLEYIRQKNSDIMVVMITSYASLEIAVKATQDGAYDFIPKPFTPQELKNSIDNITKQLYLRRITRKMKIEGKKIRYQFLSILSHELKSPLNAIEGYLNIMKEKQAGESINNYMPMVERALDRIQAMRNLTMDLLDFTKIRLEKKTEKIVDIDLYKILKMSISTIKPYAIQRNISIKLEAEKGLILQADPNDMEIIFNNLLSNAVKYNIENGEVIVSVTIEDEYFVIKVQDTGIGMSEEETKILFKEFVRIKNEKTKHITGSGLGLSIVRKISELYKGKIEVESFPGKGSIFTVYLPDKVSPDFAN